LNCPRPKTSSQPMAERRRRRHAKGDGPGANDSIEEEDVDDIPLKAEVDITAEALQAEMQRQSEVLDEFFPAPRGSVVGRGGCGRGSGHGRGRGWAPAASVSVGCSSLLVARFDPGAAKSVAGDESTSRKEELATAVESSIRPRKKRCVKPNEDQSTGDCTNGQSTSLVNPFFARIFRGGPRRRQADLPEQEDEGQEAAPFVGDDNQDEGRLQWLNSLGATGGQVEGAPQPTETDAAGEVDWLRSLRSSSDLKSRGPTSKVTVQSPSEMEEAEPPLETAANAYAGKPLPIPPFWRTSTMAELEREFQNERRELLLRTKRMAKDAKRKEQRRGRFGLRLSRGRGRAP